MKAEIVFLLDMTGSMWSIKDDTIGGFNNFVEEQRAVEGEANMTLILFNSVLYAKEYDGKDIQHVPFLTEESYKPDHNTPLLDSLGKAINETGARIEGLPENERPDKVIFVVLTDGQENASKEFSKKQILDMIKHQQEKHKWEFIYLGANQDSFAEAGSIGFATHNIGNFVATGQGVRAAYTQSSGLTASYRTGDKDKDATPDNS